LNFINQIKEYFPKLSINESKRLLVALADMNKEVFFYTSGLFGNSKDYDGWIEISVNENNEKSIIFGCPAA
jgi:hypothetical protein